MEGSITIRIAVPAYIKKYLSYKLGIDLEKNNMIVNPESCWISKIIFMISQSEKKIFDYDYNTKDIDDYIICQYPDNKKYQFPFEDWHFKYIQSYLHSMFDNDFFNYIENICLSDKLLYNYSEEMFNALLADRQIEYKNLIEGKKVLSRHVKETYKKDAIILFMRKLQLDDEDISFETLSKRAYRYITEKAGKSTKELRSTLFYNDSRETQEEIKQIWQGI